MGKNGQVFIFCPFLLMPIMAVLLTLRKGGGVTARKDTNGDAPHPHIFCCKTVVIVGSTQ